MYKAAAVMLRVVVMAHACVYMGMRRMSFGTKRE